MSRGRPPAYTPEMDNWIIQHKDIQLSKSWEEFKVIFNKPNLSLTAFEGHRFKLGACHSSYECFVWTPEILKEVEALKGMKLQKAWEIFNAKFPGLTTKTGFTNARSRNGFSEYEGHHMAKPARPLYSEKLRKDYIFIKVAQPSVWMPKQKWVWLETHPDRLNEVEDHDCFLFLDGDNRNFDPDNIEIMHRREMAVFINQGGTVKGDPEATKINLLKARLRLKMIDFAEGYGLTRTLDKNRKPCRVIIYEHLERQRINQKNRRLKIKEGKLNADKNQNR